MRIGSVHVINELSAFDFTYINFNYIQFDSINQLLMFTFECLIFSEPPKHDEEWSANHQEVMPLVPYDFLCNSP